MKTTNPFLTILILGLFLFNSLMSIGQNDANRPQYISVTTMHWNMDNEDFDMDEWIAIEKEYLDKVVKKNEYVIKASYYMHYFTEDNSELLYVQSYPSWEAMGKAADRSDELAKAAWPDESSRNSFFEKKDAYYSNEHSDEIYATMPGAKFLPEKVDKDLLLYFRKSHFAFPNEGTTKEFDDLMAEEIMNVVNKNEYIKGYYPLAHAWGSDRTEFVEAIFVESLADIPKMFDKNTELYEATWSDENIRKERNKKMDKYFTPIHGDYIYTMVSALRK